MKTYTFKITGADVPDYDETIQPEYKMRPFDVQAENIYDAEDKAYVFATELWFDMHGYDADEIYIKEA